MTRLHRPHLDFALALDRELRSGGNLPWSPYSVVSALGLAAAGARGRTYDELARALAPGGDLDGLARMLTASAKLAEAEAAVANTLWMRQDLPVVADYEATVLRWPGGSVRQADFFGDPDGARVRINDDVEQTTRGLVRELLAPGSIHRDVAAVIVNALYLKVAWRAVFAERATGPAPFHAPGGTRDVPTMRQQERLDYAALDGWRMVTLPTVSDDVAVDVLLPDNPDAGLRSGTLEALHDAARPEKIDLALPRFRIEAAASLKETVGALGVAAAFDPAQADFSGISPAPMCVEDIVHKAVLTVDEQGFEGAAATAVVMRLASLDTSRPVPFHVDRPFVVLVRHARTGAIYFLAHVSDPA